LVPGQTLVVVDDEKVVHDCVTIKLAGSENAINRVDLYSPREFEEWMDANGAGELGSRVYWIDFDLDEHSFSGIDLIRRHNIQFESILVTGKANCDEVKGSAMKHGIRVLDKNLIPEICFSINQAMEKSIDQTIPRKGVQL
jgi:hypothetical protein